jgi:hexosaminidase
MSIKTGFTLLLVALCFCLRAQVGIIPQPVSYQKGDGGSCELSAWCVLEISDKSLQPSADFLNNYLKRYYGFTLASTDAGANARVRLELDASDQSTKTGAYKLRSSGASITIKSSNPEGVFYGVQSLIQLFPVPESKAGTVTKKCKIPAVVIQDEPRFAWRGMHLDVARHFFTVSFVKEYIDYLALHKMNYFHWHLTDDQGWRIEIKKYPRLTTVGGFRNGTIIGHHPGKGNDNIRYGGFYTQEEIKEVVAYAARRYITVVPEIEMPGHASAAIAAYPELSCYPDSTTVIPGPESERSKQQQSKKVQETWGVFDDVFCPTEYTFHFFEDVLDEVVSLFPSRYIHIGGDECPKDAWKGSPFCQSLMKQKGIKDEHGLQSYFINRMEKYLNSKGRSIIGWDEILEGGLAPNATVMSWRGEEGGIEAAKQDHDVVMTPGGYCYFDHSQTKNDDSLTIGGYTTAQKVYSYEPVPKALGGSKAKHILGAQANLWTEYITNPGKVQYQVFPRIAALSEVLWSPAHRRDWKSFEARLLEQLSRYQLWDVHYSKAPLDSANK